jgi:vitamin B12 transporter
MLRSSAFAGLFGLAALGSQAQIPNAPVNRSLDPVVVTASRSLSPHETLRDAIVITREDLERAGPLSLGEVLERQAGVELRATGGPGQPQGIFIRGAGTGHTLILVDGMRVGSATVGSTAIENIPIALIERIEIVKGPLSSVWGSDAIGGVVQIFTRGKSVPNLYTNVAYGADRDRRIDAGLTTIDKGTAAVLSMGYRDVEAPSATTDRAPFCHDPDKDPYDNTYANLRVAQRLWQGENIVLEGFGSRGRTHFDGCGTNDRNVQTIAGAKISSSTQFAQGWTTRLAAALGLDRIEIEGSFPDRFETRQDQGSWINEFTIPYGSMVVGAETVRQRVESSNTQFSRTERRTDSAFVSIKESWQGHLLEGSWRYDKDKRQVEGDDFGSRNTGSVGYGFEWAGGWRVSATYGRGFRVPTFFDLYGPVSDFFVPNPNLESEKSESTEVSLRGPSSKWYSWRVTAYDNRVEDLIVYVFPTVENVAKARIRGVELNAEATRWNVRFRGSLTFQRPEDDVTGTRLPSRAEKFGTLDVSYPWRAWSFGGTVRATGDRYDSPGEAESSRLGGYTTVDARVTYRMDRHWSAELSAVNLFDKQYETSVGYEGRRRGVLFTLRFEAF